MASQDQGGETKLKLHVHGFYIGTAALGHSKAMDGMRTISPGKLGHPEKVRRDIIK